MSNFDKVFSRILSGESDNNINFNELCRLLKKLGFKERVKGSHHILSMTGIEEIINIQPRGNNAKVYQIKQVRNIRAEMQLAPSEKTDLIIVGNGSELKTAQEHQNILSALIPTKTVTFERDEPSFFGASALIGNLKLIIPIPDSLREKEKNRLIKENDKLEKLLLTTKQKLSNEEFRSRAPKEVVEKLEISLSQTEKQLLEIAGKLKELS